MSCEEQACTPMPTTCTMWIDYPVEDRGKCGGKVVPTEHGFMHCELCGLSYGPASDEMLKKFGVTLRRSYEQHTIGEYNAGGSMKTFAITTSEILSRVARYEITAEDADAAKAAFNNGNYDDMDVISEDVESTTIDEVEEA